MIRAGADGLVSAGVITSDGCCPWLCADECALICTFIELLPTGPAWDQAKTRGLSYYRNASDATEYCSQPCDIGNTTCSTMVGYATYLGRVLNDLINTALWPALRESDPTTAVTTLDDWLDRLGWQECYNSACRSNLLGILTPYEIMGECGPVFCPIDCDPELEIAVKRGTVIALKRLRMGITLNLDSINWVIAPLGAILRPRSPVEPVNACTDEPCCCGVEFEICNIGDTLPAVETDLGIRCGPSANTATVLAYCEPNPCSHPAGLPARIWPGVINAECIVRSMLYRTKPNIIYRCC